MFRKTIAAWNTRLKYWISSLACRLNQEIMPSTGIKKQKTFGHRRHIARPRTSLGAIANDKRQSSLTQLDFVSTPHASDEVISIPSSDYEDEEFVEEQPKKRRRVSGKSSEDGEWTSKAKDRTSARRRSTKIKQEHDLEKGQQTMTQMDFVPSTRVEDDIEDDYDLDTDTRDSTPRGMGRSPRKPAKKWNLPWLDQANDEPRDASSTRNNISPRVESTYKYPQEKMHLAPDLALHSIAAHDFTTPKKSKRHLEIPSSQSPPSIKLSASRSHRSERRFAPLDSPSKIRSPRRSPLKEKSANVAPPAWQHETQESQNPTMKMLQQVRLRTKMGMAPLHEEAPMPPPKLPRREPSQNETLQAGRRTNVRQTSPRKLKRTTTVQDSQAEDENIMTQMPPPKLNRSVTVQDSQCEDLDLSSQMYRSLSSRSLDRHAESEAYINDDDDNEFDDPGPHTFDPVSAALDKDAARYAWTQTQDPRTQPRRTQVADSEAESDEDETYDDDLDRGIVPASDNEDEVVLLPNPTEGPSQELCSDDFAVPNHDSDSDPARLPTIPAGENRNSRPNFNSPPSSPPALRPSQVSTIVPTQSSPQHRATALQQDQEEQEEEEYSPPTSPPRPFSPSNKPATQALTISSSPLPLPPWSSSNEMDSGHGVQSKRQDRREEPESFVDFSLPPPPPLGTSSSQWS